MTARVVAQLKQGGSDSKLDAELESALRKALARELGSGTVSDSEKKQADADAWLKGEPFLCIRDCQDQQKLLPEVILLLLLLLLKNRSNQILNVNLNLTFLNRNQKLTKTYFEALESMATNGVSFVGKTVLVTGCGRHSIGLELVFLKKQL